MKYGQEGSLGKSPKDLAEVHRLAMERCAEAEAFDRDERALCVEDMRFCDRPGGQWDEIASRGRKRANRPMYEINKVAPARNQFVGDQLQNRVDIRVRPKGGGASREIADLYEGVIRSIRDNSGDAWKDNGLKECATGGFGAWRIVPKYTTDDGWDQELCILPIRSAATSVWIDPSSEMDCHEDAQWMLITEKWTRAKFENRWPKSHACSFRDYEMYGGYDTWRSQDFIRVGYYYVKEPYSRRLVRTSDGKTYEDDEEFAKIEDELAEKGIMVSQRKTVEAVKVRYYIVSGAEVLEGPFDIPGPHIPIIAGYGYSAWIEGVHYYRGMVRMAKDPQRVYNYETSSSVETGALAPKDPYWMTTTQVGTYRDRIERMATTNDPVQFYEADPKSPGPPKRTGAPAIQAAQVGRIRQAEMDLQSTTGYFAPSLGDNPRDQSGVALKAQQRQGFTGTFEIASNHAKMVEHTGRVLVGMIPHYYDGSRVERILQEDGEAKMVALNEVVYDDETGTEVVLNDLSVGKYDVKVDVGPSFSTKRDEAVSYLTQAGSTNPLVSQITGDIVLRNMDFPGSREASERYRRFGISQGWVKPNEEEKAEQAQQGQDPMRMLQMEKLRTELEEQAAKTDKILAEVEELRARTAERWAKASTTLEESPVRTAKDLATAEAASFKVAQGIRDSARADAERDMAAMRGQNGQGPV